MKLLLAIAILFGITFDAKANVCITEVHQQESDPGQWDQWIQDGGLIYQQSLTCQELDQINNGVQVTSMVLAGAGLYAACTGVGLPATVALEGGVLFLSGLSLLISNLDCVDSETDQQIKEKVDLAVCDALEAQGISCIPPIQEPLF